MSEFKQKLIRIELGFVDDHQIKLVEISKVPCGSCPLLERKGREKGITYYQCPQNKKIPDMVPEFFAKRCRMKPASKEVE